MTRTLLLLACTLLTGWSICRAEEPFASQAAPAPRVADAAPGAADTVPHATEPKALPWTAYPVGAADALPKPIDPAPAARPAVEQTGPQGTAAAPLLRPCADCACCPTCGHAHFKGDRGHLLHHTPQCAEAHAAPCTYSIACYIDCAALPGHCCCKDPSCLHRMWSWISYCPPLPKEPCPSCHSCTGYCSGPLYPLFVCTPCPTAVVRPCALGPQ